MRIDDITTYRGFQKDSVIKEFHEACDFFKVQKGRAITYQKMLQSFPRQKSLTEEQSLVYFESLNLIVLYRLWHDHASRFPELKNRICTIFEEADTFSKQELGGGKVHQSLSDAFMFNLAGRLLLGGIHLTHIEDLYYHTDGHFERQAKVTRPSDIRFVWNQKSLIIECKRVRSPKQILKRDKKLWDKSKLNDSMG